MMLWLFLLTCARPSDVYDVQLFGAGTGLESIEPAPSPMGGRIEIARFQLWGTNLGHGLTTMFGDAPRADGTAFVIGEAMFGYPADEGFDRQAAFLSRGPSKTDTCFSRATVAGYFGFAEYVDVGDRVGLSSGGESHISLIRDPASHPRPAGESWYVGYGLNLLPSITDHADLPDTWRPSATWDIRFPGTVQPAEATFGAIPYPLTNAKLPLPDDVDDLTVGGTAVRPPHHGYDDAGRWQGDDYFDDVRFAGPWKRALDLGWTPSASRGPVTIAIRLHGKVAEEACGCDGDCQAGFSCKNGACYGDDGANSIVLGELVCTAADDGAFSITPSALAELFTWVDAESIGGATLWVARINESTAFVPDVLTWNGKRVGINPIRTRAADIIITRLEAP
jgi:hypothetical protein